MNNTKKGEFIRAAILAGASKPDGFRIADKPNGHSFDATQNRCSDLVNKGVLFKVRPPAGYTTYFTTMSAMHAFRKKFLACQSAEVAKKKPDGLTIMRAPSQPAPKKDAMIIWPARMPECRMMPPPRNQVVNVGFVHNGYGAMR